MQRLVTRLFTLPNRLHRRARRSRMNTLLSLLSLLLLTFLLLAYCIYKPPSYLINHFQRKWPDVLWKINTSTSRIALTIDDAPSDYTRSILKILADNNVHATFFVIGNQVQGREDVLRDMVLAGHELGNHAMKDEVSNTLSDATLVEQIHVVEEKIRAAYSAASDFLSDSSSATNDIDETTKQNIARGPPHYFRPGAGWFSARMRRTLKGLGYRLVLGSIYPHDAQVSYSGVNARHILSMLRPGGIIICHDRRSWTLPMLETILPKIRQRGYTIGTVSALLQAETMEKETNT